jgi:hypothetical protein
MPVGHHLLPATWPTKAGENAWAVVAQGWTWGMLFLGDASSGA